MNPNHCSTCGRPRGVAVKRESWRLDLLTKIPRTGNPEDRPAQIDNDLIVYAGIYRNGGTNADTHLCDKCLITGLLAIREEINNLLGPAADTLQYHPHIEALSSAKSPRPLTDYHEDMGDMLWWIFPIEEPPYCGSPLDAAWPGYHTHWTPLIVPEQPAAGDQ